MTRFEKQARLEVLSDQFEIMFGIAIDFSLWTPEQLARVVNNPGAVLQAVRSAPGLTTMDAGTGPRDFVGRARLAVETLVDPVDFNLLLQRAKERELQTVNRERNHWGDGIRSRWDADRATYEAWKEAQR